MDMGGKSMISKNALDRGFYGLARIGLAIVLLLSGACYIPGLIEPTEATDPPEGAISGEPETLYGKFIIYQVASGKISNLKGSGVDYMVGDETYLPSNSDATDDILADYNINRNGFENELTFAYKDANWQRFVAAGRPEALFLRTYNPVLDRRVRSLTLYYSQPRRNFTNFNDPVDGGGSDGAGDTPGTAAGSSVGWGVVGRFQFPGDVDVFSFNVTAPAVLEIKGRFSILYGTADLLNEKLHRLQLRLLDPSGTELARSNQGVDFLKYADPTLTHVIQTSGTYYVEVSDLHRPLELSPSSQDFYQLIIDASNEPLNGRIMKGEIQPARSGNRKLIGGATFEPDDLRTKVLDQYPDCDGIPGSGDEGDAGVYEMCGAVSMLGARDGKMQYQEVDDKTAIDDGEYFIGKPTNVPVFMDSEATIIKTPEDGNPATPDSLSMFISYNSGIYWLESLDGETGLDWDLANLYADRPAVTPLSRRGGGQSDTPVVSSGVLGFCDTVPAPGDIWGAPELQEFAEAYGTTATLTGRVTNSPSGYPDTIAVTFGGNNYLDSDALVDEQVGNTITSGKDGIINTFFAPRYVAYAMTPTASTVVPLIFPGNTLSTRGMNGPGTPDDPAIYDDNVGDYVYPLSDPGYGGYGGNDQRAFLLGDDEWNPAIFRGDTLTPAAYWRKQRCHFYSIGRDFDRCAYGVPEDENGDEPVAISSGRDGNLDTITRLLKEFRGDDVVCHEGNTIGICPGPDGRFGWQDIYIPLKGDDRLELVYDAGTPDPNDVTVGIWAGPDGKMDTDIHYSYQLADLENFKIYVGGDIDTTTLSGQTAVCPGSMEVIVDYYNFGFMSPTGVRRLTSIWPMYLTGQAKANIPGLGDFYMIKKDVYSAFDDEFCVINGGIAICPGQNGVFQSYPLSQRVKVDEDDDLFVLFERVKDKVGKDCYSLQSEIYKDSFDEKDKVHFVFYHDLGVRKDDRLRWTAGRGWHITTGQNGINQSCVVATDKLEIPMWQGLAGRPIITPGGDGVFQTYPLKDEKIKWADNVFKISAGADGIANSYARGDDRLELFMGTGRPDMPCVRSGDGVADTQAQNYNFGSGTEIWTNDNQLYQVGQRTGFDAFAVFGPKAVRVKGKIYLYYSALGWEELPEQYRSSAGALGDLGECGRPGMDLQWGKFKTDLRLAENKPESLYNYDLILFEKQFRYLLDNNPGVAIAPRIGLAISSIRRLRRDPTDWDIRNNPVLDLGQQCSGSLSFPISLPIDLPGMMPDTNFYGAFSPEIELTETLEGEQIFLMYYTGLVEGQGTETASNPFFTIGLARSFDGVKWEMLRDFKTVLATPSFDLITAVGGQSADYGMPTIYPSGEDEFGFDMYGMFYNQFTSIVGDAPGYNSLNIDMRTKDHIGWALRTGQAYLSSLCSLSADTYATEQDSARRILQVVILAVPVMLAGIFGFSRRRRQG